MNEVRDVLIVIVGTMLLSMEMEKSMTVGRAVDLLILSLAREGYEIRRVSEARP